MLRAFESPPTRMPASVIMRGLDSFRARRAEPIGKSFLQKHKGQEDNGDTLGGRIVHARETQDLTTSQLARRLGVKTSTVHNWETDRSAPRSNRLLTLAGMLNVSPTWLLTGVGESPLDAVTATELMQIRATIERLRAQVLTVADELKQLQERLTSYQSFHS